METLSGAQYVMVARSKGLPRAGGAVQARVFQLRRTLITYIGLQFGGLVGSIVVVEQVFAWPGMGSLAFDAIAARDLAGAAGGDR